MKTLIALILFVIACTLKSTSLQAQIYKPVYQVFSNDSLYYLSRNGAINAINTSIDLDICKKTNREQKQIILKQDSLIDFKNAQNNALSNDKIKLLLDNGGFKIKAVKRGFWVVVLSTVIITENIILLKK